MTQEKAINILSYKGDLTFDKIEDILLQFKDVIGQYKIESVIKKRLFSILVECLENTYKHNVMLKKGYKHAKVELRLTKNHEKFIIDVGNYISSDKVARLIERIELVNSLDKNGLNDLYRKSISEARISEKGGAGLGIIEIARNSKQKIKYELVTKEGNYTFFNFHVSINKS